MDLNKFNKVYISLHNAHKGSFNEWVCLPFIFGHDRFNKDDLFSYGYNQCLVDNRLVVDVSQNNILLKDWNIENSDDTLVIFYWNNYTDSGWDAFIEFVNTHSNCEILVFSYCSDPTLTGHPNHQVDKRTLDQFLGKKVRFVSSFPHAEHPNYIYSLEAACLWWSHQDIRFTEMCLLASDIVQYLDVPKRFNGYFGKPRWDRLEFYREVRESLNDNFTIQCAFPHHTRLEGRDMGDTSDIFDIDSPPNYFGFITRDNHTSNLFFMKSEIIYTQILLGSKVSILFESNNSENNIEMFNRWVWSEKGLGHLLLGKPFLPIDAAGYKAAKDMGMLHPKVVEYYENVVCIMDFKQDHYTKNVYHKIHLFIKELLELSDGDFYTFYKEWVELAQIPKQKLKENLKYGILTKVIDEKNSLYNT